MAMTMREAIKVRVAVAVAVREKDQVGSWSGAYNQ